MTSTLSPIHTLIHKGSVKDIFQLNPTELLFRFSDRYSIFDWGQMPDAIPGKGAALAEMGRKLLQQLDAKGFPTHYLRAGDRPEDMIVRAVDVPRGHLEAYQQHPINTLVPLEVIYRFGAPKGSSLLRKYQTEEQWKAAGFDRKYNEGESFSQIAFDVTTKLEKIDRPLTVNEAKLLAGLSQKEWDELIEFTRAIATETQLMFQASGMKLWDGKFEFAFIQKPNGTRGFMLVDTIGLDEIRLTYEGESLKGKPLSKELLRQHYLSSSWYSALNRAKTEAPDDFQNYCRMTLNEAPPALSAPTIQAISTLYTTVANLLLNPNKNEQAVLHQKLIQSLEVLT